MITLDEARAEFAQFLATDPQAHWPAPSMPVNARLLEALRANHQWHIDHDEDDGYPGSDLEATNLGAIAAAEAKQAGPARLTDEVIERLWYSSRGISTLFARAIETSILERNGINPQAKGD